MTAAEWLARAHTVTDAASGGPWGQVPGRNRQVFGPVVMLVDADGTSYEDRGHIAMSGPEDAAFIAHARTLLPAAVAAIEAVLAILGRDGPEVTGPEHDDWVWLDDAQKLSLIHISE